MAAQSKRIERYNVEEVFQTLFAEKDSDSENISLGDEHEICPATSDIDSEWEYDSAGKIFIELHPIKI